MTTETLVCAPTKSGRGASSAAMIGAAMPFIQPSLPSARRRRSSAPDARVNIGRVGLQGKRVRRLSEFQDLLPVGPQPAQRDLPKLGLAAAHHGDNRDLR